MQGEREVGEGGEAEVGRLVVGGGEGGQGEDEEEEEEEEEDEDELDLEYDYEVTEGDEGDVYLRTGQRMGELHVTR